MQHFDACRLRKVFAGEMRRIAGAAGTEIELAGPGFRHRDQFTHGLRGHARVREQHEPRARSDRRTVRLEERVGREVLEAPQALLDRLLQALRGLGVVAVRPSQRLGARQTSAAANIRR